MAKNYKEVASISTGGFGPLNVPVAISVGEIFWKAQVTIPETIIDFCVVERDVIFAKGFSFPFAGVQELDPGLNVRFFKDTEDREDENQNFNIHYDLNTGPCGHFKTLSLPVTFEEVVL